MTFGAFEAGDVAEVQGMFERTVAFVADGALECVAVAEVNGMLEGSVNCRRGDPALRLVERRVADGAFVADRFAFLAEMLPVVASETALRVVMPDIVRVRRPVGFHFGEEISLINALEFSRRNVDGIPLGVINIGVICPVIFVNARRDRTDGFFGRVIRFR